MSREDVVKAVDNFQTEGDRNKADEGLRKALNESYQYSKEHGGDGFKQDVFAAQIEAKKLGLPDVSISFTENADGSINKVQRDWKAMGGLIQGSTEEFNEFGSSIQHALKQLNVVYQMGRITEATDDTKKN